jgi:hypothetical protein
MRDYCENEIGGVERKMESDQAKIGGKPSEVGGSAE